MIRIFKAIACFSSSPLAAVSPLDGRYIDKVAPLSPYFSESALMRYRIIVQTQWILHMLENKIIEEEKGGPSLDVWKNQLQGLVDKFDLKGAEEVKRIQKITNHDLKSVEYYIKNNLKHYREYIHFCCTSQDINNLSYALMLQEALKNFFIPQIHKVIEKITSHAVNWSDHAMLAHTHGQPATPTTLGKQYANFSYRLTLQLKHLKKTPIYGKFNGAVGNYNAHYYTHPHVNWMDTSQQFVEQRLGLTFNPYTTQIQPHDSLCRALTQIGTLNTILIGMCRDTWEYISKGYLKQKTTEGEVGSSTMPHKVNPIDFENCQGNLGLANALIDHLRSKLPISRQQRDLSDSTVLRNQGAALGYSLIAYDSLTKGLSKIDSDRQFMEEQLTQRLEVITEAIQTQLRKVGYPEPYELLKQLSRGKSFNEQVRQTLLQELTGKIPHDSLQKIRNIKPTNYLGKAVELAKNIKQVCESIEK